MMKIILVIPTLKQGGAERVMSELANEFTKKGHDVHLCLLVGGEHFYLLESRVKVYKLGFENKGILSRLGSAIKVIFKLRALLKSIKPDFVLSFMCKYNPYTIVAASFLNLNIYVSDRSNPRKIWSKSIALPRKYTYRFASGIIAQTSLAKELIQKETGNRNISVISNPLKEVLDYPDMERKNIILNVGRLVPEKGQKFLLDAFSKIDSDNWELVILGNGPLLHDLKQQAKMLGIDHKVKFKGTVDNVDKWLARSSIFAFTSLSEGFPNALVEAMAAGLPCVSFDCDAGPRDLIVDGKNGYLINIKDVSSLTKRLEQLVGNSDLRLELSVAAKKVVVDLNAKQISNQYLEFCSKGSN